MIPYQIKPSDLCETQSAVYARLSRAIKGKVNIPKNNYYLLFSCILFCGLCEVIRK